MAGMQGRICCYATHLHSFNNEESHIKTGRICGIVIVVMTGARRLPYLNIFVLPAVPARSTPSQD
jgi:hypothetical protein